MPAEQNMLAASVRGRHVEPAIPPQSAGLPMQARALHGLARQPNSAAQGFSSQARESLLFLCRMLSGPLLVATIHWVGFGMDRWQFWVIFAAAAFWAAAFALHNQSAHTASGADLSTHPCGASMNDESGAVSSLHEIWLGLPPGVKAACKPNDPPDGADPEPYFAEAEVAHTGGQHVRGEQFACGQIQGRKQVICGTVTVTVPDHKRIVAIRRFARDAAGSVWHGDPYTAIGWCDWAGQFSSAAIRGSTIISLTFKNWSHDRARRFRLEVWVR